MLKRKYANKWSVNHKKVVYAGLLRAVKFSGLLFLNTWALKTSQRSLKIREIPVMLHTHSDSLYS